MTGTYIIAEAGVNHNGDVSLAMQLVEAAARCGADAVKFQTFRSGTLVSRRAPRAEYQKKALQNEESQLEMLRRLELKPEAHYTLQEKCRELGIDFLSTAFDLPSLEFLVALGMPKFKIPSGEITNYPLIRRIAELKGKVLLSTGMASIREIADALEVLETHGTRRSSITVLHCNTEYPTPPADVNLRAMQSLQTGLQIQVGYSDHTAGIEAPLAAVVMGASVIEKHITLDNTMSGPDHSASLEPSEFKRMVDSIHIAEEMLGSPLKEMTSSEAKNRSIVRKSIVAARPVKKGELFTEENITTLRPGDGLSPMLWPEIVGVVRACKDFEEHERIVLG